MGIIPDYSENVAASHVYTRVARAIIHQLPREPGDDYALDIMGLIHFPKYRLDGLVQALPSWVPDWYQLQQSYCARIHLSIKQPVLFAASGVNRVAHMLVTTADDILGLGGYYVDEVAEVDPPWPGAFDNDYASHLILLREVQRLCAISTNMPASARLGSLVGSRGRAEAVWRVPVGGIQQAGAVLQRATSRSHLAYNYLLDTLNPSLAGSTDEDQQDSDRFVKNRTDIECV